MIIINTRTIRGNWNHFKITQTVPEQHTGKHKINYRTQPCCNCTDTAESTNVKVQNIFSVRNDLHVAENVNTEQLQHYIPYKHCLFQVHNSKYPA